jgi:hypothetical protein
MLPRDISPAARARRSLLADLLAGLLVAVFLIVLSAGIGIVGFVGLVTLLLLASWFGIELLVQLARRRRSRRHSRH